VTRSQRFVLVLGALLAAATVVWMVRTANPELGTGELEATWAPQGLRGLLSSRGVAGIAMSFAALVLLTLALRPGRRATPATFFSAEEKLAIQAAIAAAEDQTSGEIRVHLARSTRSEVLEAAKTAFQALRMDATAARNGVLIYLSVEDHRFAIVGDVAIDRAVPEGFWDEMKSVMQQRFVAGRFAEGIVEAVDQIGEKLHAFFPIAKDDVNEITDEISTEE
jgi:uncharacterized membrane protein